MANENIADRASDVSSLTVKISESLYKNIKTWSVINDRKMSDIAQEALSRWYEIQARRDKRKAS